MNKGPGATRQRLCIGINNMDFYSLRWIWIQHWNFSVATFPKRTSKLIILDLFIMEMTGCVLNGVDICSRYRFAFLAPSVSAKTTIRGLTECLSTITVFHTASLVTNELTSQQSKSASWFHWSYHVFIRPETTDLVNTSHDQVTSYRNECFSSYDININSFFLREYLFT